jgi:Protein of unknown function (DUF4231)
MIAASPEGENIRGIPESYLSQIDWYDIHAMRYRYSYLGLQTALLVFAALTAVLTTVHLWRIEEVHHWLAYLPVLTSLAVVILAGILNLFSFQEQWLNYRASCEKLRREVRLFQLRGDAYAEASNPEQVFAERAESIIAGENALWLDLARKPGSAVH